jgi:hypothetical protein
MSQNHTPGPWEEFEPGVVYAKRTRSGIEGQDEPVCAVYNGHDESAHNISLIAAAPDLLAALESCVNWMEQFDQFLDGQDDPDHYVYQAARAAIAKAKGIEP